MEKDQAIERLSCAYSEIVSSLVETIFPVTKIQDVAPGHQYAEAALQSLQNSVHASRTVCAEVLRSITALPPESQRSLFLFLELLTWRAGTLALGGFSALTPRFPFVHPFAQLSLPARERILQGWANSSIPKFLEAFKGIKALSMSTVFSCTDEHGHNPLWPGIQYKGPDVNRPQEPLPAKAASEKLLTAAMYDISIASSAADLRHGLAAISLRSAPAPGSDWDAELDCDIVVVGSGAGGGVAAALLAKTGAKVVVVEKGHYTCARELTLLERDAFGGMYEGSGLMTTDDAGINILAGATLGGGTRINWSASFPTPAHVRREWAQQHGLKAFESEEYDRALEAVTQRLGVTTGIQKHSRANQKLKDGLERLGVHCGEIPRNSDTGHSCGCCGFGCASGAKQDGTATFLADAIEAGAKILTGGYAQRILMSKAASTFRQREVTGVLISSANADKAAGQKRQHRLLIRCSRVVAAAGALHTPALLLRSGITAGGSAGANLRLHPATVVTAVFPKEEGPILGWEGAIMSIFSREVADWEGTGYGPLLATPSAHPGLTAASFPWPSGEAYRLKTLMFPYTSGVLIYVRDRGCGRVYLGPDGQPRLRYWLNEADQESMMKGMLLGLRAMVAAGADSVMTLHSSRQLDFTPHYDSQGSLMNTEAFEEYLESVRKAGVRLNRMAVLSAHQMGSARIGNSRTTSVADPNGQCWDTAGLYIFDGSALPTSTGVNPMVTVEAVSYMLASRLAAIVSDELAAAPQN